MRKVVLVGTAHEFQRPETAGASDFQTYLANLCDHYGIAAIGEEMSEAGMSKHKQTNSVCYELAERRGILHRYCDPNFAQRAQLNMPQENAIRVKAWQEHWPEEEAEERINRELRTSESARERYWLGQLTELDCWPAIFVCGANHVDAFQKISENSGIDVIIAANDWAPRSR